MFVAVHKSAAQERDGRRHLPTHHSLGRKSPLPGVTMDWLLLLVVSRSWNRQRESLESVARFGHYSHPTCMWRTLRFSVNSEFRISHKMRNWTKSRKRGRSIHKSWKWSCLRVKPCVKKFPNPSDLLPLYIKDDLTTHQVRVMAGSLSSGWRRAWHKQAGRGTIM
jgi:hypothetical protein